jgi:hypothetical protein
VPSKASQFFFLILELSPDIILLCVEISDTFVGPPRRRDARRRDMMSTTMHNFIQLIQDSPDAESHLLVAFHEQPQDRFEVTEVIQEGISLVLRCQAMETGNDPEPSSPRDDSEHTLYKGDNVEFLSRHDPLRFYEDLR